MKSFAFLSAVLLAAPLLAQTASETVTVEVVDVPVYVVGPHGPITNLTRDDFELSVNGKQHPIDYFDVINFSPRQPGAATVADRDPRNRRLFLLLFDLVFSRPAALARAQTASLAMIHAAYPNDYFAIATLSSRQGAQFVTPFTADRAVAERAVASLRASDAHDPLGVAILSTERDATDALTPPDSPGSHSSGGDAGSPDSAGGPSASGSRSSRDAEAMANLQEILGVTRDLEQMPAKRLIEDQITDLSELSKRLEQLEGYKHVIFLSEGFSHVSATGMRPGLGAGQVVEVDPHMMNIMKDLGRVFRASGAFVDTIDLGTRDASSSDTLVNESLHMIADQTGGQFIPNATNTAAALAELNRTTAAGYHLGFKVPSDARRGDNTIDVKVRNVPAATHVSFRSGFSTTHTDKPADALRLADVLYNDMPQSGTAPRIGFGERPNLLVAIPAKTLIAQNNGQAVDAEVLLYLFDANGAAVDFKQKKIAIPANATADIVIRDPLNVHSGRYTAKALLLVGSSVGFARQEFVIP